MTRGEAESKTMEEKNVAEETTDPQTVRVTYTLFTCNICTHCYNYYYYCYCSNSFCWSVSPFHKWCLGGTQCAGENWGGEGKWTWQSVQTCQTNQWVMWLLKKKLINTDFHLMSLLIPPLSLSHHYWFCVFQVTSPAQTARKMRRDRTCQRRFVWIHVCSKCRLVERRLLSVLTLCVVQDEKTEGRGRRKRKLSTHKVAAVKESGDEKEEMESKEQPSAEVNTTMITFYQNKIISSSS